MSFSGGGFSFGGTAAPNVAAPTTAPSMGLTAPSAAPAFGGGSFSFGATAPAAAPTATGLPSFGAPPAANVSFGAAPTSTSLPSFGAPPGASVSFGGAQTSTALPSFGAQPTANVSFGVAPTPSSLPSFGAALTSSALPSFGTASTTAPSIGLAAPSGAPSFGGGSFSFGATTPAAAPTSTALPSFGAQTAANVSSGSAPTSTTLPSFGAQPTANVSFGVAPTSSALPSFGVTATTAATLPAFGSIASTASAPVTSSSLVGPPAGLTSITSTTQSVAAPITSQLTFSQIEELINKYTLELEEQEKVFINQATQVNMWDKLLNSNSNKILELNAAVEKVKGDQKVLEDELKFIEAQHTELEECITPLKVELDKVPHVDMEKAQTYLLAENLDTQLRQMSEDLKEVIEHLNEVNKLQDPNDPIVQIGRILNAHMNSLQWIESTTSQINVKLDDINKIYDTVRRDTERSLRLTYCD